MSLQTHTHTDTQASVEGLQHCTAVALHKHSLVEQLQQLCLVLHHFLTPGVGFGAVKQVGPTAQLLLEHGPESRFGTQNLKAVNPSVNTALLRR